MVSLLHSIAGIALLYPIVSATPEKKLDIDFPDPSFVVDSDTGTWYSFATGDNDNKVKVATASAAFGPWSNHSIDLLPNPGAWAENYCIWAPDVTRVSSDHWVMYYTAPAKDHPDDSKPCRHRMCVGAASADNPEGPYTPVDEPLACPADQGGAIDPSGYYNGLESTQWVVYKVDGNSIGKHSARAI